MKHLALIPLLMTSVLFAQEEPSDAPAKPDAAGLEFFEKNIRPILSESCYECHSNAKNSAKGSLILDSKDGMLKGGEEGPAVVPGNLEKSLLIRAVRYEDAELAMPPKKKGGKLPDDKIALLEKWIQMGAPSPDGNGSKLTGLTEKAKSHWAYQPIKPQTVPQVKMKQWVRNPIDAFVLAKIEEKGLLPNPEADPEAYLRRVYYDLIGLPPTSEQVEAFMKALDAARIADSVAARQGRPVGALEGVYEKQVDFLLASPHYGERWARHWMDTSRYSDTTGQLDVNDTFERYRFEYAWTYRDYLIDAFNTDKPYDEFVVEQLAADRIPGVSPDDPRLAALGFLTVGKRFDNKDDEIDERIDTTTKAFLGMTVACSRCHDHKFDPIPAEDYYSLHGIFASIKEPREPPLLAAAPSGVAARADYEKRLNELQDRSLTGFYRYLREVRELYDKELAGRLMLATVGGRSVEYGDIHEKYKMERIPDFEAMRIQVSSPITGPFARLLKVPLIQFEERAARVIAEALVDVENPVNPLIAAGLRGLKPKNIEEVAVAYQKVFNKHRAEIMAHVDRCSKPGRAGAQTRPEIAQLASYPWPCPDYEDIFPNDELLAMMTTRKFCADWQNRPVYGGLNNNRPNGYFMFPAINALRMTHPGAPKAAMIVQDVEEPRDSYVYIRGDRNKKGEVVPRRFLEALAVTDRRPYVDGSGRLEFARSIVDKSTAITQRVAVNRIWLKHFGDGIVTTPDDFGNMSLPPSHPELLDWLAADFVANGWKQKRLHRMIVLSSTYRQDSNPNVNPLVVKKGPVDPLKVDAANRLLWRGNLRRLDFESIRDSMLVLTGKLDPSVGGRPVNITDEPYSYRRSLYGYIDRRRLDDVLTQFDYADPDASNTKRNSTIVPQQALFFMNNPLSVEVARAVAARKDVVNAMSDDMRVTAMYRALFQRRPTSQEVRMAREFVDRAAKALAAGGVAPGVASAKAAPVARGGKAARPGLFGNKKGGPAAPAAEPKMMAEEGEGMVMAEVAGNGLTTGIRNVGERVSRNPLTPIELLAQALMLSNEFVYIN